MRGRRLALAIAFAALTHAAFLLVLLMQEPGRIASWREGGPALVVRLLAQKPTPSRTEHKAARVTPASSGQSGSRSSGAAASAPTQRAPTPTPGEAAPAPDAGVDPRVRAALRGLAGCRTRGFKPTPEEEAACANHFARLADAAPKLPISNDPRKMKELKAWGDYNLAMREWKEGSIQYEAGVAGLPRDAGMPMPQAPEPEQKAGTCRVNKNPLTLLSARVVKCKFW
jgi:hypothetical protein